MLQQLTKVILWGGTGQAKVVRPIIEAAGMRVAAVVDDTPNLSPPFPDIPLYFGQTEFEKWYSAQPANIPLGFSVTIGNPHGRIRIERHTYLVSKGLRPITPIHETAWIDRSAKVGDGSQIMAGAILMAQVVLGTQCIVNTKASVDHECILEDGVEIAPGATLCGLVHVAANAWVGAGATILPRIRIGTDAIVGAGAVVTQNVPDGTTVVGVPAKRLDLIQNHHKEGSL